MKKKIEIHNPKNHWVLFKKSKVKFLNKSKFKNVGICFITHQFNLQLLCFTLKLVKVCY